MFYVFKVKNWIWSLEMCFWEPRFCSGQGEGSAPAACAAGLFLQIFDISFFTIGKIINIIIYITTTTKIFKCIVCVLDNVVYNKSNLLSTLA